MVEGDGENGVLFPRSAGEQLRAAREAAGLDLADVAAQTRIPQRHLEALEADRFDALPSPTYSIGFAKAHARVTGADEVAVAAAVRAQLDESGRARSDYVAFEPADPARVPPRYLAWTAAAIAVLLIAGYLIWRNQSLEPEAPAPVIAEAPVGKSAATPEPAAGPAPAADQRVVLTATDRVWLRISDDANPRLFEKEMVAGERYEVPADARNPTILTGRPQSLTVTVGGREVAPLGEPDRTISGVGVSAQALLARGAPAPAATPGPGAAPAAAPPTG